ncbi:hypothetical protein BDK51DRAFT_30406 [Blyttiomyces helicus]|uniref:Uncharacterized protein n=1 Tax=Blyttiomyces helicus TaxID=388810 RepID=A0A4P9WGB2_9FUNG|nr:hypothetical protein BDK51DRAFT_30406 [Blyttiomyces helicus]|eukprot:RKO91372.1 hypothetical protein BDK51DRAFT_30406 [Blyttiomyces helicus]
MLADPGVGVPKKSLFAHIPPPVLLAALPPDSDVPSLFGFPVTSSEVLYEYCAFPVGFFLRVTFSEGNWGLFQIRSFDSLSTSPLAGCNDRSEDSGFLYKWEGQVKDEEDDPREIRISAIEIRERRPVARGTVALPSVGHLLEAGGEEFWDHGRGLGGGRCGRGGSLRESVGPTGYQEYRAKFRSPARKARTSRGPRERSAKSESFRAHESRRAFPDRLNVAGGYHYGKRISRVGKVRDLKDVRGASAPHATRARDHQLFMRRDARTGMGSCRLDEAGGHVPFGQDTGTR